MTPPVRLWSLAVLLALSLLAACAPRLQPPGPGPRVPALGEDRIVARDGRELPLRVWRGETGARAVILALHGFNDHAGAFDLPGRFWSRSGIATYAYDQRGFGATAHRGLWPGVPALVADVHDAIGLLRARHPGQPLYLAGESMGAAVIMAAMAAPDAPPVDGLVLSAPAVWGRPTMGWLAREALWLVAHTMPWYPVSGRGLSVQVQASDNIEMLRGLGRDPLVIKETRADALWGLVDVMDAALAAAPRLGMPVLLLYGARDELIPRQPVEMLLGRLAAPHRVALYADGWHLLFRDLRAETVWRDVEVWMADRAAPLPSGAERHGRPLFGP